MDVLISRTVLLGAVLLAGCRAPLFNTAANSRPDLDLRGMSASDTRDMQPARGANGSSSNGVALTGGIDHGRSASTAGGNDGSDSEDNRVNDLLNRAHAAEARNRYEEAQQHYRRVLERQPDHPVAHHRLAVMADKRTDYRTAEQHYQAALRSSPNDPDLLSDIGYSYLLQGEYRKSEKYLRDALAAAPSHQRALNNLGYLYGRQGKYDRALAVFRYTGTEEEARKKMAQLFPQGRPAQQNGTLAGQFNGGHPAARNGGPAETTGASTAPVGTRQADSPAGNHTPAAPNEATRRLKQMMDRARRQSIAERVQNQTEPGRPGADFRPPAEESRDVEEEIPPERVKELFAQIDGGSPVGTGRMKQQPLPDPQRSRSRPSDQSRVQQTGADPLEGMPLWPPESAQTGADGAAGRTRTAELWEQGREGRSSAQEDLRHADYNRPARNAPPRWPHAPDPGTQPAGTTQSSFVEESAHRTRDAFAGRDTSARPARRGNAAQARREAALLGLNAGPGSMFPPLEESRSRHAEQPTRRNLPENRSQIRRSRASAPSRRTSPPESMQQVYGRSQASAAPRTRQATYRRPPSARRDARSPKPSRDRATYGAEYGRDNGGRDPYGTSSRDRQATYEATNRFPADRRNASPGNVRRPQSWDRQQMPTRNPSSEPPRRAGTRGY